MGALNWRSPLICGGEGVCMSSEGNRFCGMCGAPIEPGLSYCPKCGAAVSGGTSSATVKASSSSSSSGQMDWREQRRQERAERREERHRRGRGVGALIVAAILIVAGLAIFFPSLPWQFFWGSVLILIGLMFVYFWLTRSQSRAPQQQVTQ